MENDHNNEEEEELKAILLLDLMILTFNSNH